MTSFFVESCHRVQEGVARFDVRMLSGELAIGDRFDCQDGMGRFVRFHVRSLQTDGKRILMECVGPIIYDDQFSRFTINTKPFPPKLEDLPIPANLPVPTSREDEMLRLHFDDWSYMHPLQRAVCLCILREQDNVDRIAAALDVPLAHVRDCFQGLSDHLRGDPSIGVQFG